MAGAVYVIKDKGWAAMERGGCGSGERRRNATVTMITAARLTRAPLGRLAHVAALSSVTPPLNYLQSHFKPLWRTTRKFRAFALSLIKEAADVWCPCCRTLLENSNIAEEEVPELEPTEPRPRSVPLTIICGFLGAGKSTLVK